MVVGQDDHLIPKVCETWSDAPIIFSGRISGGGETRVTTWKTHVVEREIIHRSMQGDIVVPVLHWAEVIWRCTDEV